MAETPAELMRRAAALMLQRADAASPGTWHEMCMGSEGCSVINDGRLRERKHVCFSGRKEWKADHADTEHIASWGPIPVRAVAKWLNDEGVRALGLDGWEDSDAYPLMLEGFAHPLAVARDYLGAMTAIAKPEAGQRLPATRTVFEGLIEARSGAWGPLTAVELAAVAGVLDIIDRIERTP